MRVGSGGDYFILFNPAGAILKGFAHESMMSPYQSTPPRAWPGVLDDVPKVFSTFLSEPAFTISDTTFCIWRTYSDTSWQRGNIQFPDAKDPDGSADLLAILDGIRRRITSGPKIIMSVRLSVQRRRVRGGSGSEIFRPVDQLACAV